MLVQHPLPHPPRPTTVQRAQPEAVVAFALRSSAFSITLKAAGTPSATPPPVPLVLGIISRDFLKFPLDAFRDVNSISQRKWTNRTQHKHTMRLKSSSSLQLSYLASWEDQCPGEEHRKCCSILEEEAPPYPAKSGR